MTSSRLHCEVCVVHVD